MAKKTIKNVKKSAKIEPSAQKIIEQEELQQTDNPIITKLLERLHQEQWTRIPITDYSVAMFKEIEDIVLLDQDPDKKRELIDFLEDYVIVKRNKQSFLGLYAISLLDVQSNFLDYENFVRLIGAFIKGRQSLLHYFCLKLLSFGENRIALKHMFDLELAEGQKEEAFAYLERLVALQKEDYTLVKKLGLYYKDAGNINEAIFFYKTIVRHYIQHHIQNHFKELWKRLLDLVSEEVDKNFFFQVNADLLRNFGAPKAFELYSVLYAEYKDLFSLEQQLDILKILLKTQQDDEAIGAELLVLFRKKYYDFSQLEDYISLSGLEDEFSNKQNAVHNFESFIPLSEKNFVLSRQWGVGYIRSFKEKNLIIDFAKQRNHVLALELAVQTLLPLDAEDMRVYKAIWKKDKLQEKVLSDIPWVLNVLLKNHGAVLTTKAIKSELVPDILSDIQWPKWSKKMQTLLETDDHFTYVPGQNQLYALSADKDASLSQTLVDTFNNSKKFFDKVKVILSLMHKNVALPKEKIQKMGLFFSNYLTDKPDEFNLSSHAVLSILNKNYSLTLSSPSTNFSQFLLSIPNLKETFVRIPNNEIKKELLLMIRDLQDSRTWISFFKELFLVFPVHYILTELEEVKPSSLKELGEEILSYHKEYRNSFLWLMKNNASLFSLFDREQVVFALLSLFETTYKEIRIKKNTLDNKKWSNQILTLLYKKGLLQEYIQDASVNSLNKFYTIISHIQDFPVQNIILSQQQIEQVHPDFEFPDFKVAQSKASSSGVRRGFLATKKAYWAKQKELAYLRDVELPANSKEIAQAADLGDLRENAEYQTAKERQNILTGTLNQLTRDLESARVVEPGDINSKAINFGTVVTLFDNKAEQELSYTILGPWESDPKNSIISYLSPLGEALLNKKVKNKILAKINETNYDYTVKKIAPYIF